MTPHETVNYLLNSGVGLAAGVWIGALWRRMIGGAA